MNLGATPRSESSAFVSECRVAGRGGVRGRECQRAASDGGGPAPPSTISTQECPAVVCLPAARGSWETAATSLQRDTQATRERAEQGERQRLAAEGVRPRLDGYQLAAVEQLEPAVNGLGAHHNDYVELVRLVGVGAVG